VKGGKGGKAGRPKNSFRAPPTKTKKVRVRESSLAKIYEFMERKGIDFSELARDGIDLYMLDSDGLDLPPKALKALEGIMTVGGYKTKGEAVSASLMAKRRELMESLVNEKNTPNIP
jgi:hypothetical protein